MTDFPAKCHDSKTCCTCKGPLVAGEVGTAVFVRADGSKHIICGLCKVPEKSQGCVYEVPVYVDKLNLTFDKSVSAEQRDLIISDVKRHFLLDF